MTITLGVPHYAKQTSNKRIILLFAFVILLSLGVSTWAQQDKSLGDNSDRINALLEAVKSGKIAYKLTEPEEVKALLGPPVKEVINKWNGTEYLILDYPADVQVWFRRIRNHSIPFTLDYVTVDDK